MVDLVVELKHIEETKDAGYQCDHFNTSSDNVYKFLKVSKYEQPIYCHHYPIANGVKVPQMVKQGKCT